jgi:micrococcal nuclease
VAKVVDGDTVDLDLDLGFSITLRQRVRLYGIDAPELRSKDPIEKAKGQESQAFVVQWFQQPGPVLVRTTKEEKYGRMLADCYREGAPSLCTELLQRGLAAPYLP